MTLSYCFYLTFLLVALNLIVGKIIYIIHFHYERRNFPNNIHTSLMQCSGSNVYSYKISSILVRIYKRVIEFLENIYFNLNKNYVVFRRCVFYRRKKTNTMKIIRRTISTQNKQVTEERFFFFFWKCLVFKPLFCTNNNSIFVTASYNP